MNTCSEPPSGPVSVGELLQRYSYGHRITGWDWQNPPEVELGFRSGYLTGADRFVWSRAFGLDSRDPPDDLDLTEDPLVPGDMELAANLNDHLHELRAKLYDSDHWTDCRAALLRGCQHGLLDAVRARAAGVSVMALIAWLDDLRKWAREAPVRLDWDHAEPPDPPEPDGPPLELNDVPRRLQSEVFGMWVMFDPPPNPPARERGPFIESKEQYERLRAAELVKLREAIRAHKGEFTGLEALSQYEPDVQAVWREVLAARQEKPNGDTPTQPLGNIERILHPDPAVRNGSATGIATVAERWPEPKTIAELDCPESLDWIWQGWVAVAHITALVAKWKAGKTTLLHHLLCARERGGDIAGAVTPGLTLVISEEHPTLWRMRSANKAIAEHVRFICLPPVGNMSDWLDFTNHVVKLVMRDSYSLVVYDTLPGLAPLQDENANSQMLAFLRPLLRLKDVGTGTLLITHPPKGHTGDDFNVRGASALMGFADQLMALKRPEGDPDCTQRILKCIGRLGEPIEQTIELRDGEYITLGTKLDIQRAQRRAALRAILPPEPPGLTVEEIIAKWPAGEKPPAVRTLRRFLADWLNKDGKGTKDDPGRYWW